MTAPRPGPGIEMRIFVVGVPRSGTTLVQSLLAAHSRLTSFTESHFFDRHFRLLPGLSMPVLTRDPAPRLWQFLAENGADPPPAARGFGGRGGEGSGKGSRARWLRPLLPARTRAAARGLLQVLDELSLARGAAGWIEKTPRHLRYLPFLQAVAGSLRGPPPASGAETHFVHVLRDGLEAVASLHRASRAWERPYDLDACVDRWNEDVAFSLGRTASPNDHFVFYEEVTGDPEAVLRPLLADLGLPWEREILERYGRGAEGLVTEEETWKARVGRPIRPSATSRRTLTAEQRQRVRRALRRDLYDELRDRRSAGAGGALRLPDGPGIGGGSPRGASGPSPVISVVVPFLNGEGHLAACIEALLGQEGVGEPFEILLVDNGSTDGSAALAGGYDGVTLLREETPGAYAARNAGIRQARAPLVAFTDADCVVDRYWLRSIREGMEDPGVGILLGACRYPGAASLPLKLLGAYENAKARYVIERCGAAFHFGYTNNMAVRASLFEELGPFKEWKRAADSELLHRRAERRPDLRTAFCPSMGVTHLEFLRARDRARRLSLYTQTNAKIETFRELGVAQRLGVLSYLLRGRG